jgi:hypothetical protein
VTSSRRFPPPWTLEETDACFIVKDCSGISLAYVYFEEKPGRRAAAKLLYPGRGAADRCKHRQTAGVRHKGRVQREPLTRGRPTERGSRVALIPVAAVDFSIPRGVLDPNGSADPGRGEVEESVPVFRISRRLGPGQALTRVGAVLLRGMVMLITFRRGDSTPREGRASEQKCTRSVRCGWCG